MILPLLSQQLVLTLVAKIEAFALFISCIEYLATPELMQATGLMSWEISRFRNFWLLIKPVRRTLDLGFAYPNVRVLLLLEGLLACTVIIAPPVIALSLWVIGPLALLLWLFIARSGYGHDGTDQLHLILFTGLWLISVVHSSTTVTVYLCFTAFQGCLSYATAGFAKATEKGWRDGTYLVGVCNTAIYGHPRLGAILASYPSLACWLARLIVFWECAFPLVFILPLPFALLILAGGFLFHLTNAYVMGLNTFLWGFIAIYPAILYC